LRNLETQNSKLDLNALFIQPTRWCASPSRVCKGCYVRAHKATSQASLEEHVELFRRFYEGDGVSTKQITISLDVLPLSEGWEEQYYAWMVSYFKEIYSMLKDTTWENLHKSYPQVHVTARDIGIVHEYIDECDIEDGLRKLTVLSLSRIDYPNDVRARMGILHFNYNCMPPPNCSSSTIDEEVEHLARIGRNVDSIYMILHKSPVGGQRPDTVKWRDRTRWRSDIQYMKTMLTRLPHLRSKIQIDGCLKDVVKAKKTGYGCNCNVSRFQVWPDGSVSGCPYAISSNTGVGATADKMIDNIRKAKEYYDFEQRCHLSEIHNSLLERPSDSRKRI